MNKIVTNIHPTSKLSDLIVAYPDIITAIERLGISLGFGDQSVKEISERYNLNVQSFMSILRVFEDSVPEDCILEKDAVPDLVFFLKVSHKYFREKQIPGIRDLMRLFVDAIPTRHGDIIISFFDGYIREVNEHFLYEEDIVFPYIDSFLQNPELKDFDIREFEKNHTDIEQKLLDLKNILIKYIPENISSPYRIQILRELITLERDLTYHTRIEDYLLVPTIKDLEKKVKNKNN